MDAPTQRLSLAAITALGFAALVAAGTTNPREPSTASIASDDFSTAAPPPTPRVGEFDVTGAFLPDPLILDVQAAQRVDASKLVDITYTLEGAEDVYLVNVYVDDGSGTFSHEPIALFGHVGPVAPGTDRHIVWDIVLDPPPVFPGPFRVRVQVGDVYGDSEEFLIDTPGEGFLSGGVYDFTTGAPLAGAAVHIPGLGIEFTGADGSFWQAGPIPAGPVAIEIAHDDYYGAVQELIMRGGSVPVEHVFIPPVDVRPEPEVVDVRSRFMTPDRHVDYVEGVDLNESYTVKIDWHNPVAADCALEWSAVSPSGTRHLFTQSFIAPCPDTSSAQVNVGTDFQAGERLELVASYYLGAVTSDPYLANFDVVAPPVLLSPDALVANTSGAQLNYDLREDCCGMVPIDSDDGMRAGVPSGIPFFGGEELSFGVGGVLSGAIKDDGSIETSFSTPGGGSDDEGDGDKKKAKVGKAEFTPSVSGTLTWEYNRTRKEWDMTQAAFTVGVDGEMEFPAVYVFTGVYFELIVGLSAEFTVTITGWAGELNGEYTFGASVKPWAEGVLGGGVNDAADVEAYLRAGAYFDLEAPITDTPCWGVLKAIGVFLRAGLRAHFMGWEIFDLSQTWKHDLCGESLRWTPVAERRTGPRLLSRDYLDEPYAIFVADTPPPLFPTGPTTTETAYQRNVFPQSVPAMAAIGTDLIMTWIRDDTTRSPINRTELVYSRYNAASGVWSPPAEVDVDCGGSPCGDVGCAPDDCTADYHPQTSAFPSTIYPSGRVIAAWENLKQVLEEPADSIDPGDACDGECGGDPDSEACRECKIEETKANTEITVAEYGSGAWGSVTHLTNNGYLDRTPRLVTVYDGTPKAMVTWVANTDNDFVGSDVSPNSLHYATYNGFTWTTGTIDTDVPSVVQCDLAYNGTDAIFIYSADTDYDYDTRDDRELFAYEFSHATGWGSRRQLTGDGSAPVEDANPKVVYDSGGSPVIVWYRGGDFSSATTVALSDQSMIVDLAGGAAGAADFELAAAINDQLALVWQAVTRPQTPVDEHVDVDVWFALFDPNTGLWSRPLRLTNDRPMERGMAPVFDSTNNLLIAYNKVEIVYTAEQIDIDGRTVQFEMPGPGQADLYTLRHVSATDLSPDPDGLFTRPRNPVPGESIFIGGVIRNLGDLPVIHFDVEFFDGHPDFGGTLIAAYPVDEPLVGGGETDVGTVWDPPLRGGMPHDIYVRVFSPEEPPHDENNIAVLPGVMRPDLSIDSVRIQNAGLQDRLITVRVRNGSGVPSSDTSVTLRLDSPEGPPLGTIPIVEEIVAGAFHDVSFFWYGATPFAGGSATVYAIVDEEGLVDEFDEDNNVAWAVTTDRAPTGIGDWDRNGIVDLADYGEIAACISGPWLGPETSPEFSAPSWDCLDVLDSDDDRDVDLKDLQTFQWQFGTGGAPGA